MPLPSQNNFTNNDTSHQDVPTIYIHIYIFVCIRYQPATSLNPHFLTFLYMKPSYKIVQANLQRRSSTAHSHETVYSWRKHVDLRNKGCIAAQILGPVSAHQPQLISSPLNPTIAVPYGPNCLTSPRWITKSWSTFSRLTMHHENNILFSKTGMFLAVIIEEILLLIIFLFFHCALI